MLGDYHDIEVVIEDNTSQTNLDSTRGRITGITVDLNEENGLQIINPKRRRIEEPSASGPLSIKNAKEMDTDMTEENNLSHVVSKNGFTGSVKQTRRSL